MPMPPEHVRVFPGPMADAADVLAAGLAMHGHALGLVVPMFWATTL